MKKKRAPSNFTPSGPLCHERMRSAQGQQRKSARCPAAAFADCANGLRQYHFPRLDPCSQKKTLSPRSDSSARFQSKRRSQRPPPMVSPLPMMQSAETISRNAISSGQWGWTSANESYRRNYDRFTAAGRSTRSRFGEGNGAARRKRDHCARQRSQHAGAAVAEWRHAADTSTGQGSRLVGSARRDSSSLAGPAPKLDAPSGAAPLKVPPTTRPVFGANAIDLAQAVRAARLRISRASNGVAQTIGCSDSGASSCAS